MKSGCCAYGYIVQRGIFIHFQYVIRKHFILSALLLFADSGFEPSHIEYKIQCYNHYCNSVAVSQVLFQRKLMSNLNVYFNSCTHFSLSLKY
jgi:hypothetical protein